jgi:putative LysE/RhtB family amino acid efflux pump
MHALIVGAGLGCVVAMQVGPMSLFLLRSTLRGGWRTGAAIGLGIACVDGAYAACGAAGAAPLVAIGPVRVALGLAGAAFLGVVGVRTIYSALHIRAGGESALDVATPARAFRMALAGTASNPLTIASWAAVFAAASTAGAANGAVGAELLVTGVTLGSLAWMTLLASVVALLRQGLGERTLRVADGIAGISMLGFGGALVYSTAHER